MKKADSLIKVFCLLSVALGVGLGFLLRLVVGPTKYMLKEWIQIPGNLLLSVLQMFALPLIVTSVLAGVTDLNIKMSRKAAIITGGFICIATFSATCLGVTLVLSLAPGAGTKFLIDEPDIHIPFSMHVIFMDLFRNMIPESFFQAFFEQYKTEIIHVTKDEIVVTGPQNNTETRLIGSYVPGANLPGLTIWSFAIGILINGVGEKAKSTVKAIQTLNEAIKIIVHWFMWYLPFGILFLIADNVLSVHDWGEVFKLVKFVGVVCMGQGSYAFIILPMVYFVIIRQNPFVIYKQISKALLTAFIIASSTATLPVAFQCCEENVKVNKTLLRLILPIVLSINMNGTTIYEVIASIFITQINDIKLEVSQIIAICLSSSIVTFGTAGIPARGAMNTIMILTAVGLPARDAVNLLIFEWLLDHLTAMVNILSNIMGVIIINSLWKTDLLALQERKSPAARVRSISELELDLTCLEPDDEFIPSAASPSRSISNK